jgi:hypothetical protein
MPPVLRCNSVGPFFSLRCEMDAGHHGDHSYNEQRWEDGKRAGGITASWHEPEPEKPREWIMHLRNGVPSGEHRDGDGTFDICCGDPTIRVHDADTCDKKHSRCSHSTECLRNF